MIESSENYSEDLKSLLALANQFEILKETSVWQKEQVDKLCNDTTLDQIDEMTDDEKRTYLSRLEEMMGRLWHGVDELITLGNKYDILREKINKRYGKEVLHPLPKYRKEDFIPLED